MKQLLVFLFGLLFLNSCQKHHNDISDIKIGTQDKTLEKVVINKFLERKIVLSGGDGRYRVNIEDSKIAHASINQDTLKIKGILEGETFAKIISHDKSALLKISVEPQLLLLSHNYIELYPTQELRSVSLSGGGDIIDLEVDDPQEILQVRLNGSTGIVEIKALYEGEATLKFTSANLPSEKLKVVVKSEGPEPTLVGVYQARNQNIYPLLVPNLVVKRANVGVWLCAGNYPEGETLDVFNIKTSVFIQLEGVPQEGQYIDVSVKIFPYPNSIPLLKEGKQKMYVKKINKTTLELTGKGFRIILPYA